MTRANWYMYGGKASMYAAGMAWMDQLYGVLDVDMVYWVWSSFEYCTAVEACLG